MFMVFALVLTLVGCSVLVTAAVMLRRGRHRTFPPVVELAQTTTLPRLGHKLASMTARQPTSTAEAGVASPRPSIPSGPTGSLAVPVLSAPPVMFVDADHLIDATAGTHDADVVTASNGHGEPINTPPAPADLADKSVYEFKKSPYATSVVQGSLISLPDDDEGDLPIKFRSAHPTARPIVEAGDKADHVRIAGVDGRIHLDNTTPVVFGPSAD